MFYFFFALTILCMFFVLTLYQSSHAFVAQYFGCTIEEVRVGLGPSITKFVASGFLWDFRLIPVSGFTKIRSTDSNDDYDDFDADWDGIAFVNLPFYCRVIKILAGVGATLLFGFLLVFIATQFPSGLLVVELGNEDSIYPSAIPNLSRYAKSASLYSQYDLFCNFPVSYVQKLLTYQKLEDWGGIFGAIMTCAAVGKESVGAWFSLIGIGCLGLSLLQLLPLIPISTGGILLKLTWERYICNLSNQALVVLFLISMTIVVPFVIRLLILDIQWILNLID